MFDDQPVNIRCQNCGAHTTRTVGWIKLHDSFTCRCCGADAEIERKHLLEDVEKTEEKQMKTGHLFR